MTTLEILDIVLGALVVSAILLILVLLWFRDRGLLKEILAVAFFVWVGLGWISWLFASMGTSQVAQEVTFGLMVSWGVSALAALSLVG